VAWRKVAWIHVALQEFLLGSLLTACQQSKESQLAPELNACSWFLLASLETMREPLELLTSAGACRVGGS